MQSGDTESATFSIGNYIWMSLVAGRNLSTIEDDCRTYTSQIKRLNKTIVMNVCNITWQFVLNLMGRSKYRTKLTSDALDKDVCRREGTGKDTYTIATLDVHKIVLYSIFGECEEGAKLALEVGDNCLKANPGHVLTTMDVFHRGLCLFAAARKLKEKAGKSKRRIINCDASRRIVGCWGMESKCINGAKSCLSRIKS